MGVDQTAAAGATVPADGADAGLTLAGLIDVLDRADDAIGPRRPRPRRAVLHRSPAVRTVADRWDPLREAAPSQQLPARPIRTRTAPHRTAPLRSVPPAPVARMPMWPMPAAPAQGAPSRPTVSPVRGARWRAALRTLLRRAALWGAGPGGVHLAWGGPPPRPASHVGAARPIDRRLIDRRPVDPPVVLRELPSTPTDRPAAPSPAAAGATAAPRVERWVPPGNADRPPARVPVSRGPVPTRARSPGGIRGSPATAPARGSPPWWPEPG